MSDTETRVHFRVARFIHEAGLRLRMESLPLATASTIYHRFFQEASLKDHDPYQIATTALYLAGKVEEQYFKLRDVVNVCYRVLHKSKPPLEIGDQFFNLRDSVANCELFVMRMLQFKVVFSHPHKYLLHYLKFLKDWFEPSRWEEVPVARTAWAMLQDSYHSALCLQHPPQHRAVAILYLALMMHGLSVPCQQQARTPWWKVFSEDITLDIIQSIIQDLIATYDLENTVAQPGLPPTPASVTP